MKDNKIPLDTQWNDIEYMTDHLDFTIDNEKWSGLPNYVNSLHENGMHYVMIVVRAHFCIRNKFIRNLDLLDLNHNLELKIHNMSHPKMSYTRCPI